MTDQNEKIYKICTDCGNDFLIARKVRKCPTCGYPLIKDQLAYDIIKDEELKSRVSSEEYRRKSQLPVFLR
jgi:ribosomal protein L37E